MFVPGGSYAGHVYVSDDGGRKFHPIAFPVDPRERRWRRPKRFLWLIFTKYRRGVQVFVCSMALDTTRPAESCFTPPRRGVFKTARGKTWRLPPAAQEVGGILWNAVIRNGLNLVSSGVLRR